MACNSLSSLPRACSDGSLGGVNKVYIIAYKDLATIVGANDVFSASTSGIVNAVGLASGKTYVEIGLLKDTSGLTEKLTKDNTKGTNFFTQTFSLVLGDITPTNTQFIQDVKGQPVSVIYKTRTNAYFILGLNGQFEITTIEGGTGVASADLIGHTCSFEGISSGTAQLLDPSIVASLIAA